MAAPLNGLLDPELTRLVTHIRGGIYSDSLWPGTGPLPSIDISQAVISITFTESYREAAMRCELVVDPYLVDPVNGGSIIHVGTQVVIYGYSAPDVVTTNPWGPTLRPVFTGTVFTYDRNADEGGITVELTVYDPATILARNDGAHVYNDMSLSGILVSMTDHTGLPLSADFATTTVPLGQIVQGANMSYWDVLTEARQRHYDKTREVLFARWDYSVGKLSLLYMGETGVRWKITDATTLISANFQETAENLVTHVDVYAEEYEDDGSGNEVLRQRLVSSSSLAEDHIFRQWFGVLRAIHAPNNSDQTQAESDTQAAALLAQLGRTNRRLTTESILIPGLRRGDAVEVISSGAGVFTTFVAETVRTQYQEGVMTQAIDLVIEASDLESV